MTPAQTYLEYSPGQSTNHQIEIINSDGIEFSAVVVVDGELNQSISLSEVAMEFNPSIKNKNLDFTLNMPSGLKPGTHSAEITVLAVPSEKKSKGAYVNAVVGLKHKILVEVPHPGKYAEAQMHINPSEQEIAFIIPVINQGQQNIAHANAIIEVYSPLNEKIVSLNTNDLEILSGDTRELSAIWDITGITSGRYLAVATVVYDEETINLENQFSVGGQILNLKSVDVKDFELGGIAKFEFLVESSLNEIIPGTYIEMEVLNKKGESIVTFKSANYDINPSESKLLVAFWDTEGIQKGTYDARALIKFREQSIQNDFELEVSDDEINVVGIGYVIREGKGSVSSNSLVIILGTAVGILVVLNLIWFLVLRKKLSGKNNK
jgi:hypothetical protein